MQPFIVFVVLTTLQILSAYTARADYNVYTPTDKPSDKPAHGIEMPAQCKGKSYCTIKGDNYPDKKIEKLVKKMDISLPNIPKYNIGSRTNTDEWFEDSDCPSNQTNDPVYYIMDENDELRVVVQQPGKFLQLYDIKWCQNEGRITKSSSHFSSDIVKYYNIECVSSTIDFDFFVLKEEGDEIKTVPARAKGGIPVCCRCRYNGEASKK